MRRWVLGVLLALVAALAQSGEVSGRVIRVADGDTLTVLDAQLVQHKVRLQGVDAPEKAQPFGQRSKARLASQVFGRVVTVQYDKRDKYGRIVGKVLLGGHDVNLGQVAAGQAWHYKEYQQEQLEDDRHAYAAAEGSAQVARLGLWSEVAPIAPWEFRRSKRP